MIAFIAPVLIVLSLFFLIKGLIIIFFISFMCGVALSIYALQKETDFLNTDDRHDMDI